MENLSIDPKYIVDVPLTGVASLVKPVVFKEGNAYCCILGLDPVSGVFGCGDTPELAIADWDETLQLRLKESAADDEVVKYVKKILADLPKPDYLQAFYDQFRPAK